ncbi:hypothetical protein ACQPZF_36180 [Actinosynnema sp. CS-041913]|uniref:hypothetical protein n=1 Tax=Actinosynnema sp. CS-041913 TaxID=3239917 RepID=UPI003D8E9CC0
MRARTDEGSFCQTCYKNHESSHAECQRCGTIERLHHRGLCPTCAYPEVIRELLTPSSGTMRPELQPVLTALTATDPHTGLNWAARARTRTLLSTLATANEPISHSLLDRTNPSSATAHLRALLVNAGALPPRDERLVGLERAIDRRIERVSDPDERKILRSFATWHHLRRLRALTNRRSITPTQVDYARNSVTAAATLLTWLQARGQRLATCTQADIDDWLTIDTFSRSRGFVTWAVNRGHSNAIKVPPHNNQPTREVFDDHEKRWSLARQLLHDNTIATMDRVAGLLVLLYAQRAIHITQLTTEQITRTGTSSKLLIGAQPIHLPDKLGNLITQLTTHRAYAMSANNWLFPGARPGRPLTPNTLIRRLHAIGIPATVGRNTALMDLAAEMPAAVLSQLLGISTDRAARWNHDAGNTRPGYAAEVARRNHIRST